MGGHATHDENEARETFAAELFRHWGRRDPVGLFEAWLAGQGVSVAAIEQVERAAERAVRQAADRALESRNDFAAPDWALFQGFSQGGVLHGLAHRLNAQG